MTKRKRPRLPRWHIDVDAVGWWMVVVLAIVLAIVYVGTRGSL